MATPARTFEDLAVFQKARALTKEIYRLTRIAPFASDQGLVDQIRRASVSILSNIAERFERGGNAELIQFLYIAKGSCGEVRAQLLVALDQSYIDPETHTRLEDDSRHISSMLNNLIAYLRGSNYQGSRYTAPKVPENVKAMLEKYRWKPTTPLNPHHEPPENEIPERNP